MPDILPPRLFRLLLVEDDLGRVQEFRSWLPARVRLVWAQSAGAALGLIRRDRGHVYGGVLLDYDLNQRTITEDDETLSGSDVTLALIANFSIDTPILVHSMNWSQAPRVARQLEAEGFWVTRIPYYSLTPAAFLEWLDEALGIWEDIEGDDPSIGHP